MTSEARNRVNVVCLNVSAKDDVVFNTLLRSGDLRLKSTYGFKLHYLSLGLRPRGLTSFAIVDPYKIIHKRLDKAKSMVYNCI